MDKTKILWELQLSQSLTDEEFFLKKGKEIKDQNIIKWVNWINTYLILYGCYHGTVTNPWIQS